MIWLLKKKSHKEIHKVKRTFIVMAIMGFFGFFMILEIAYGYGWHLYQAKRRQPIAFSHRLHVGKQNIQCTQCHLYVGKSRHAGIPFVETCMQCHKDITTQSPEIEKLLSHWRDQKPIEWANIYRLPDFIYFSHKRHIMAKVDCSECHGKVERMETIRQVSSLKMGWCISCHTAKGAPRDCWTCHK